MVFLMFMWYFLIGFLSSGSEMISAVLNNNILFLLSVGVVFLTGGFMFILLGMLLCMLLLLVFIDCLMLMLVFFCDGGGVTVTGVIAGEKNDFNVLFFFIF